MDGAATPATLHWSSDLAEVDWDELSALYRIAPLGEKDPARLKVAFAGSRIRWFVREQGRLVAVGRVLADGCDVAYLCDIAVHPAQQGTGLGQALTRRLLDGCAGYPKVLLYAKPGKEGFYRGFGFRRMTTAMAIFEDQARAVDRGYLVAEAAAREPLHIGIVGCSAEGAALCYRSIVEMAAQRLGGHRHPEISMHTPSLQAYVEALDAGDRQAVANLMLGSARKLAAAGAAFLICPDNTIHQAMPLVRPASPLPWLHIAEVVAAEAQRRGFRRVGLTGTAWLVASDVYPQALAARGIACVKPDDATRLRLGALIMGELVHGVFKPETTREFQQAVVALREQGCDAVVLGCTEIPLILGDHNCALPTLDSTRLLAAAALDTALARTPAS